MSTSTQETITPQATASLVEQALVSQPSQQDSSEAPPAQSARGMLPDFFPNEPTSLAEAGLQPSDVEALVLKQLLGRGPSPGRSISECLALPHHLVSESLESLRGELMISLKSAAGVGDFLFELTDAGHARAERLAGACRYWGPAPVPLEQYTQSVAAQSPRQIPLEVLPLCQALADLLLPPAMISQLGQALNAGRGLFLYGPPGNGKTSIAERVTRAFGQHIWIPRTISLHGELLRFYDPSHHEAVSYEAELNSAGQNAAAHDRRWVLVKRPTVVVGGELTLPQLDLKSPGAAGVSEAPVHLKANGGTFVVDDFGRQRATPTELLNRLIVPLEKSRDYFHLPSGRQVEIPLEQLMVFATNLSPRELVDEAFLRRIPYKIEVPNPSEAEFRDLFSRLCPQFEIEFNEAAVDYLVRKYYLPQKRPFRFCHPRDLIRQVKNLCEFHRFNKELSPNHLDVAVRNYFTAMPTSMTTTP